VFIFDTYVESVAAVPFPLHSCWRNETHLDDIWKSVNTASEYVLYRDGTLLFIP